MSVDFRHCVGGVSVLARGFRAFGLTPVVIGHRADHPNLGHVKKSMPALSFYSFPASRVTLVSFGVGLLPQFPHRHTQRALQSFR